MPALGQLSAALLAEINRQVKARELTTYYLAKCTALSQPHISNILAGRRKLTIQTADALALALRLTTNHLLELALDAQTPPPPPHTQTPTARPRNRRPNIPRIHFHPPELLDWPGPEE